MAPSSGAADSAAVFDGTATEFVAAATGTVADADEAAGDTGPYASMDAVKKPLVRSFTQQKNTDMLGRRITYKDRKLRFIHVRLFARLNEHVSLVVLSFDFTQHDVILTFDLENHIFSTSLQ